MELASSLPVNRSGHAWPSRYACAPATDYRRGRRWRSNRWTAESSCDTLQPRAAAQNGIRRPEQDVSDVLAKSESTLRRCDRGRCRRLSRWLSQPTDGTNQPVHGARPCAAAWNAGRRAGHSSAVLSG
jgi:hypothetical protein